MRENYHYLIYVNDTYYKSVQDRFMLVSLVHQLREKKPQAKITYKRETISHEEWKRIYF